MKSKTSPIVCGIFLSIVFIAAGISKHSHLLMIAGGVFLGFNLAAGLYTAGKNLDKWGRLKKTDTYRRNK